MSSLDKCKMIWLIQIFVVPSHPTDSFLVRYLHFHIRQTYLVSSFSRRSILTNQKRRRACDFTCSTFTASETKTNQVLTASRFEGNLFLLEKRSTGTLKCKIQLTVSSVGYTIKFIDESGSLLIYNFFLAVENQICILCRFKICFGGPITRQNQEQSHSKWKNSNRRFSFDIFYIY